MVHMSGRDMMFCSKRDIENYSKAYQANELQSIDDYRQQYQHRKLLGRGVIVSLCSVVVVVYCLSGDKREGVEGCIFVVGVNPMKVPILTYLCVQTLLELIIYS